MDDRSTTLEEKKASGKSRERKGELQKMCAARDEHAGETRKVVREVDELWTELWTKLWTKLWIEPCGELLAELWVELLCKSLFGSGLVRSCRRRRGRRREG